jgi:chaperonin GroEL
MEYNNPSLAPKDLQFGVEGRDKILHGIEKLNNAVKSTLGASGKCVVYQDALQKPVITKDGVTVANSVVLEDPVENMGADLVKEAARNTVNEAGDGTTTATILAYELIKELNGAIANGEDIRELKDGVDKGYNKVIKYLDKNKVEVKGNTKAIYQVATISCNNDEELGDIIGQTFEKVGGDGVVIMEESEDGETRSEIVDGIQMDTKLKSNYWITNKDSGVAELENPVILLMNTAIPNIRKIQDILEFCIKQNRSLLIIAETEYQVYATLLANKVKGVLKCLIVDPPGFGPSKIDTIEDIAILTGAKLINEEIGDDLNFIDISVLGTAERVICSEHDTIIKIGDLDEDVKEVISGRMEHTEKQIKKEKNLFLKKKLEKRLAMLNGSVGIVKVGAFSKVEMKEKKDRVEDAIFAVKAALREGIVPGGGVALKNAAQKQDLNKSSFGEYILLQSILEPFKIILENAHFSTDIEDYSKRKGVGVNVVTGKEVDMIKNGIIDPVFVTKTALKNAISVAKTVISADCVISNKIKYNESH